MGLFDRFRRRSTGGPAAVRARLEGAMAKRRLRGWNPPLENINALVASGGPRLLARSRELVVTNGYAANACEAFAANLVGDGIKPSSLIEDAGLRDRVQRLWLAWTDEADADGLTDFYGLQAMVAREMFVAGECFVRLRPVARRTGCWCRCSCSFSSPRCCPSRRPRRRPTATASAAGSSSMRSAGAWPTTSAAAIRATAPTRGR
jgi:capsid protein